MHRSIAAWLTERPWHAAVAAAFCGALSLQMVMPFMVLAGAIPVLVALRSDSRQALAIAATAAAAAVWIVLSIASAGWIVVGLVALIFAPALLGLLLKRSGSLNLCFQISVTGAAAVLIAVHVALADPAAIWVDLLEKVVASMSDAGLIVGGDTAAMVAIWARTMW